MKVVHESFRISLAHYSRNYLSESPAWTSSLLFGFGVTTKARDAATPAPKTRRASLMIKDVFGIICDRIDLNKSLYPDFE